MTWTLWLWHLHHAELSLWAQSILTAKLLTIHLIALTDPLPLELILFDLQGMQTATALMIHVWHHHSRLSEERAINWPHAEQCHVMLFIMKLYWVVCQANFASSLMNSTLQQPPGLGYRTELRPPDARHLCPALHFSECHWFTGVCSVNQKIGIVDGYSSIPVVNGRPPSDPHQLAAWLFSSYARSNVMANASLGCTASKCGTNFVTPISPKWDAVLGFLLLCQDWAFMCHRVTISCHSCSHL